MELIERALEFETRKTSYKTTNERIVASREVKALILDINEIYKETIAICTKTIDIYRQTIGI